MREKETEATSVLASAPKGGVALVDDHPIFRYGLIRLISQEPDLEVCWEAGAEGEAWQLLKKCEPAIVIVDLDLKSGSGIDLIKRIKQIHPALPILVLSTHEEEHYVERALRAGACGYVMKREACENVMTAIRKLLAGQVFLSDHFSPALLRRLMVSRSDVAESSVEQLSDRELQVFSMIAGGKGRREIADELHLSAKTVETYQAHIKKKLGLGDSRKLVHHAVRWALTKQSRPD
jgi:DNA-binding NarL/FixJ family response regulator